jgi:hypothetical protein
MLFTKLRQVCTVVHDFESTVTRLTEDLGIGPFRCWHFRPPVLCDTTLHGEPTAYTMKLAITWQDDIQWEVITPVDGPSLYREHLTAHGRGVQHLLMATGSLSFEDATRELAKKGHELDQTARINPKLQFGRFTAPASPRSLAKKTNLRFGYLDLEKTLRTSIELTHYPLGFSERFALRAGKPEFTLPPKMPHFERGLPNRQVGRVVKVSLVTRDLEGTAGEWARIAGVSPWHAFMRNPKARVAWARLGDVLVELVEPTEFSSAHKRVLESRGEGVASVGVTARTSYSSLVARCEELRYARLEDRPLVGDVSAIYFSARHAIGTDIEILRDVGGAAALFASARPDRVLTP